MLKNSKFFKFTSLVIAILLALSVFSGCSAQKEATATSAPAASAAVGTAAPAATATTVTFKGEILVGGMSEITGTAAMAGLYQSEGAKQAVDEINAAGGVLGKKLVLDFQDDAGTTDGALLVIQKFIAEKVVAIVGPMKSTQCLAVNANLQAAKMITIYGGTSPKLSYDNLGKNEYAFMMRPNDSVTALNAAKYLVEKLGAKKVGICYNTSDFGTGGKGVIEQYLTSKNIPFISEGHNTGDKDFSGAIMKFKNGGCDSLALWGDVVEFALLSQQLTSLGYKPTIIGCGTLASQGFTDLCEPANIEGWYSVTEFSSDGTDAITKKAVEAAKKYNALADQNFTSYYSGVYMLADAIKRAGTTDTESLRKALKETKDVTTVYKYTTDSQHRMVHVNVILKIDAKKTAHTVDTVSAPIE